MSGELANTQILLPPNLESVDLHNSNLAVANLRDPENEITIQAVAASWVEIVRDNGEEVDGNTPLYLSTGNAGGLVVIIGSEDPLSMGHTGEIVRDLPLVAAQLHKAL